MGKTARLFVAAYPPWDAANAMEASAAPMLPAGARATAARQIHMTLLFIGETDEREVPGVIESIERAVGSFEPIVVKPLRLVTLPRRGPARLLALETDAPSALVEMQKRVAHRLARPSQRGDGAFLPHLTLARFDQTRVNPSIDAAPPPGIAPFTLWRVSLMTSLLRNTGAEHTERWGMDLRARG